MKGEEAKEQTEKRRMGRLGGEKPPGPLWLVRFLNRQTDSQDRGLAPHTVLPSTSGKISFVGDSAEDQRMERQRDRTGAAAADWSPPLRRAVISYAQDKLLTQSHTAC